MTIEKEFTFLSTDGKTQLHGILWKPEGKPVAVLQIVHGMAEHIGRYAQFARYLNERGIAVVGHDLLGHGKSVTANGTMAYFGDGNTWQTVVNDIYALHTKIKAAFPDIPYMLMGHSMGSFLTRTFLIRYPRTVEGTILMGTAWQGSLRVLFGLAWTKLLMKKGADKINDPLTNMAFKSYYKHIKPVRTPFDWLSVDPEIVDQYIADPLCGGLPTVGLFHEMLKGFQFNQRFRNLDKMDGKTPILLISGAKDPVGDMGAGVRQTYAEFKRSGIADCEIKLYPGLRHEILNEKSTQQTVFEDIGNWIEEKMA